MTYDDLIAMAREGDPLIDPRFPDSAKITDDGLLILGNLDGGEMSDMLVRIEPDGRLRAWFRDPAGATGENVLHGPDWTDEVLFPTYADLVAWAYSW